MGTGAWGRAVVGLPWLLLVLVVGGGVWGCGPSNPNVRVRRLEDGRLQVAGPLAGPFKTLEELAAGACELMTSQPGASNGLYGFEYCALYYHAAEEQAFFLSYLSDIGGNRPGGAKYCEVPTVLDDPNHVTAVILGVVHNHPHNRQLSPTDTSPRAHWRPTRFFDEKAQRIFDRQLMVFYREKSGECRAYAYNNSTRVISALREGQWVPIGQAKDDAGNIQMYEGKGWLP